MVKFTEEVPSREEHLFVKEDPARIYRGLKDLLVDEFDMERVEEGTSKFSVSTPKDDIEIYAYKRKSPHTALKFELDFTASRPSSLQSLDRPDDIFRAYIKVKPSVVTFYPGNNPVVYDPDPAKKGGSIDEPALKSSTSGFEDSKFYRSLVGFWYRHFYGDQIERYQQEAEQISVRIHNLMREKFGIGKAINKPAAEDKPTWGTR
ncbi:MAG: hypothetical protein ABEJ98_03445 [Candidatus Nanohaloarchaea archaeon]